MFVYLFKVCVESDVFTYLQHMYFMCFFCAVNAGGRVQVRFGGSLCEYPPNVPRPLQTFFRENAEVRYVTTKRSSLREA